MLAASTPNALHNAGMSESAIVELCFKLLASLELPDFSQPLVVGEREVRAAGKAAGV
jgi:hypothetical protein